MLTEEEKVGRELRNVALQWGRRGKKEKEKEKKETDMWAIDQSCERGKGTHT